MVDDPESLVCKFSSGRHAVEVEGQEGRISSSSSILRIELNFIAAGLEYMTSSVEGFKMESLCLRLRLIDGIELGNKERIGFV